MLGIFESLIWAVIGGSLILMILAKPYFGLIITISSLPVVDLLPPIPILSSAVVLVGLATVFGALLHSKSLQYKKISSGMVIGFLFTLWLLFSNPQAAWFGDTRNWFLTFLQLWILMFMSAQLLDTPQKHITFIWFFALVGGITGVISISQGNIGESISTSLRASGLSGNPNSNGRYLVVAMIQFYYLFGTSKQWFYKFFALLGILITFFAVFFTLSRSSILILFFGIGLLILLNFRKSLSVVTIILFLVAFMGFISFSDQLVGILNTILPSITLGTDTVGVRYRLWEAGIEMWRDFPIVGVGIGNFINYLPFYGSNLAPHYWFSPLHNTYLSALVETGLVGFVLFMILVILSFRNFWVAKFDDDKEWSALRNAWFVIFLVVGLGEVTANGLYDKLFWFLFGISIYIREQSARAVSLKQPNTNHFLHNKYL